MNEPKPPTGNGPEAFWHRAHLAFTRSMQLIAGPGYRVNRTPAGQSIVFENYGGGEGASVGMYRLKAVFADYFSAAPYDPTTQTDTGAAVNIAKAQTLRHAASDTLGQGGSAQTVQFTYTQVDTFTWSRSASIIGSQLVQVQTILPRYKLNDFIWAISAPTGVTVSGSALTLLALADGRMWSKWYDVSI